MPVTIVASSAKPYPTGGESASFTLTQAESGYQGGDVVLAVVTTATEGLSSGLTPPSPGTTTLFPLSSTSGAGVSAGMYWYDVPAAPPSSLTWSWGATARRGDLCWVVLRPASGATLVQNAFSAGAWTGGISTTHTASSITTTQDGCLILAGTNYGSGGSVTVLPAGATRLLEATQREGTVASLGTQSSAGATGAAVFDTAESGSYRSRSWQLAVFEEGGAAVPVIHNVVRGIPTHTGVTVSTRTADADEVRLRVANNQSMTGATAGPTATPDSSGWCKPSVSGLSPDTDYWLQVEAINELGSTLSTPYVLHTAPTPGQPASFSFLFGGDLQDQQGDTLAFTNMAVHDDARFFLLTGDSHNGDNTSTSQASHRADWENIWSVNAGFKASVERLPHAQSFGDHDQGGGNNSVPGAWTAPNIAAYQQVWPTPPSPLLPATTGWSFVWGRVRFISPDWGHERTATYKLGPEQMAWLEAELNQPEPLKVLLVGSVWYDEEPPEGWPGGDGWSDYADQRAAIQALIDASPGDVLALHGDQHALAAMSGAGNAYGGFPVVGGSPLSGWSSHKGDVTPDSGRWPLAEGAAVVHQYGRVAIEDSGDYLVVTYQGYDDTNAVRVTLTFGTEGYVAPAPVPGTSTASLSSPADRWIKGVMRASWYDETLGKWRAILPTSSGHRLFTFNAPGESPTVGPVVDARQGARVSVCHHEGTTYALAVAPGTDDGVLRRFTSAWTQIGSDSTYTFTGLADLDAQPVTMFRSTNGHLWFGWFGSSAMRVMRSRDDGATLGATGQTNSYGVGGAYTGVVGFAQSGDSVVQLGVGNDGIGRFVRAINQNSSAISQSSWTLEALPSLPSPLTSDDHLSMLSLPDGRIIAVSKTTGSTDGSQTLLYSLIRSTSGTWTMQHLESGPDNDPGWTRPVLTLDGSSVVVLYGNYAGSLELVKRTTSLDLLGVWSERSTLLADGDYSDSASTPLAASGAWPVFAHNRATDQVWVLWQGLSSGGDGKIPARLGQAVIERIYLGTTSITAAYLGGAQLV